MRARVARGAVPGIAAAVRSVTIVRHSVNSAVEQIAQCYNRTCPALPTGVTALGPSGYSCGGRAAEKSKLLIPLSQLELALLVDE